MTPIAKTDGQITASSPATFLTKAAQFTKASDHVSAARMLTLGIDMYLSIHTSNHHHDQSSLTKYSQADFLSLASKNDDSRLLSILFSNRAQSNFSSADFSAALADAMYSVLSDPQNVAGHLLVLRALESSDSSYREILPHATRATLAVPLSVEIADAFDRIKTLSKGEDAKAKTETATATATATNKVKFQDCSTDEQIQMRMIIKIAEDDTPSGKANPSYSLACGDYGTALITGSFGLTIDEEKGERMLTIGANFDDPVSCRNLGLFYLQKKRSGDASSWLRRGADLGDEESKAALQGLGKEAEGAKKEAFAKLEAIASGNGPDAARAREMLLQFSVAKVV